VGKEYVPDYRMSFLAVVTVQRRRGRVRGTEPFRVDRWKTDQ
jgi:hypothetical protein